MTFAVQDYHDLTRLLDEHPGWRAELRRLVLSDELLALPEIVRQLATAQQRTEARVEELAEAQRRTEARLEALTARVEALTARVDALTARVEALTADVHELTASVHDLAEAEKRTADRVGHMMGDLLELRYREHAAGYFGVWLRRAQAVPLVEIEESLEAVLPREDVLDILRLDLLVNGRWLARAEREPKGDAPEVWLAVEVAAVLNEGDVARAWRRATLLRRAGYRAVPVVAGETITQDAEASARAQSVAVVQDGQGILPAEGLASWLV
jgi:hypothetical protein